MSGTSLDGIDVACIVTDGERVVERGAARTFPYDDAQRALLRQALQEATSLNDRDARPGNLAEAERALTLWHVDAVQQFRAHNPGHIDIIGFHGQTVIHRPERGLTVQLGDGEVLAKATGIPVAYDLRANDVAHGGQGAPLVPAYHRALAAAVPQRPVAFVNIGGVANVTWIGAEGDPIAFDTGPGNALLNDWCERHIGEALDRDGALSRRGVFNRDAWLPLGQHPYFDQPAPKSLDRNSFAVTSLAGLSPADGARTLVQLTVTSIARSVAWFPERPKLWIICGGGRLNPVMMGDLKALLEPLGDAVSVAEDVAMNGDSMEAEAWAYLAVRAMRGLAITFPMTTGVREPLSGGRLTQP